MLIVKEQLQEALQEYFGFDQFKGNQKEIIESIIAGKDTFVLMPTGGGKSLCYQLPAIMSEGTAIIISPLIALMKNQVDLVRSYSHIDNIAHFLNSSLNKAQIKQVKQDIMDCKTKMLYVAPETLTKQENIDFFKEIKISFIAVDEAHCISEWGHDFRPEYRRIRTMIQMLEQKVPIIALTATATPKVQQDILKTLQLEKPNTFVSSFDRPNLYYEVRPKGLKAVNDRAIVQFVKANAGKSGIIYVLSRKSAEEVAQLLNVNGIKAAPYHAGLEANLRAKTQDDFLMEEIDVVVATIAFGMGIDKPDIRFVIHYNIAKSIENYYQETGRAGRDGLEGKCIAYYNYKDIHKLEKFMRDKSLAEREMGGQLLQEMVAFVETATCRRNFLLHYFGEDYNVPNCGHCDNCTNPKPRVDGSKEISIAIQTLEAVYESLTIPHLINMIMGRKNQEIVQFGYDKLECFGNGSEKDELFWSSLLRQALLADLLRKDIEQYGVLKITDKGREYLKKPWRIEIALNHNYEAPQEGEEEAKPAVLDPELLNQLRDLRRIVAKEHGVPPYVIFQDPSLEEMATAYPITVDELSHISGVSKGKAVRYGSKFLKLIEEYVDENDIDRPEDFTMKSVVNKSGMKVYIIQSIDRKLPIEDIARAKGITQDELLHEIETIVLSGTKLNIDYYIRDVMDDDTMEMIYDYFHESDSDSIDDAFSELGDEGASVEDIQLVRLKFLSEMAN